ncbi:23 kDa integral membrane protein-like [Physella acuta]|uniref:23 kDa integral membrane protein-like n=1 Tax=Physella acuta TaxID=109671 RepID=UPI0027DC53E2|nr:23 kDa integral membrane protein-like [Physella acuta]
MVAVECSKVVVVIINIIFMIFGLAALVAGIVFKVGWEDVRDVFDLPDIGGDIQLAGDALAYGAIVFGAFILVLALLGCIGACCKVRVLLAVYAIVVIILLIAQVAIVVFVAVKGDFMKDKLEVELQGSLKEYKEDGKGKSTAWSSLFDFLECCGAKDPKDFRNLTFANNAYPFYDSHRPDLFKGRELYIPITCCKAWDYSKTLSTDSFNQNGACLNGTAGKFYNQGCVDSVVDKVDSNKAILIGVGVAILVIELVVIVMAFFLCCRHDD